VVGSTLVVNGAPRTIAGIMPPGFDFPGTTAMWLSPAHLVPEHPLRPTEDPAQNRGSHYLGMYGRLRPGVTIQVAQAEQRVVFERLLKAYPQAMIPADVDVPLLPLRELLVGDLRPALLVLLASVGLVLLIGCANLANLMLARAAARAPEIRVRAALGAGRMRIARQLLTESAVLSLAGGALGLLAAVWLVPAMLSLSPASVRDVHAGVTLPVVYFAVAASLLTGLLFGLVPAIQAGGAGLAQSLRASPRSTDDGRGRLLRKLLIAAECAMSVALLIVAGLLIRSLTALRQVETGFRPDGLVTSRVVLPPARYATGQRQAQFFDQALERLRARPDTARAAAAARLPFVGGESTRGIQLDQPSPQQNPAPGIRVISPGYFDVIGQPIVRGREFTARDRAGAPLVAVINETMARLYWPGADAIGRRFQIGTGPDWITVVGIAADVKHASLREAANPEFYQPYAQAPWSFMTIVVRTALPAAALTAAFERDLAAIDPALPAPAVRPMNTLIAGSFAMDRFETIGIGLFAAVALALAVVGLYGVMSYLVSRRSREMGLRIALGAGKGDILRLVMREGLQFTAVGIGAGLLIAAVAARAIRGWLFGVRPADPATFAAVTIGLGLVALLASYLPARRATAVDPMIALRGD
jgi:putative ABC transport system permease protein